MKIRLLLRKSFLFYGLFFLIPVLLYSSDSLETGCWFFRDGNLRFAVSGGYRFAEFDGYFRIHYPANDPLFVDQDGNQLPDILEKHSSTFEKSRHFLQTQLGWILPASRTDMGRPQLDIYFVHAGKKFIGTTRNQKEIKIFFNIDALRSADFPAIWMHQFAHAAELQYAAAAEYWFYEATAGWMEARFVPPGSEITRQTQVFRFAHPEVPLNHPSPEFALGASRFLEMLSQPVSDVIRQAWQQLSFEDAGVVDVLGKVLALNHLPDFESYLQNYFLLFSPTGSISSDPQPVFLKPYSATVLEGFADSDRGGIILTFHPQPSRPFATSLLFYASGQKSGILSLKKGQREPSSILIPYPGLDHYRFAVVNTSGSELTGKIETVYDETIPGVLEYFRVNTDEGGVQIEWKTSRENGVAFWNLYRIREGKKERLNDFPIPASIQSEEGVHYIFIDTSAGAYYSLEALTTQGFPSPLGSAESSP